MTVTETPAAVAMVARKRLKYAGAEIAAGTPFTVDDPARASLLVRSGHATAAPEGEAALAAQVDREGSERGRRAQRPPAPALPEKAARASEPEAAPPPVHRIIAAATPTPELRVFLGALVERIDALEATVARLSAALEAQTAEPTPKARQSLTRKVTDA